MLPARFDLLEGQAMRDKGAIVAVVKPAFSRLATPIVKGFGRTFDLLVDDCLSPILRGRLPLQNFVIVGLLFARLVVAVGGTVFFFVVARSEFLAASLTLFHDGLAVFALPTTIHFVAAIRRAITFGADTPYERFAADKASRPVFARILLTVAFSGAPAVDGAIFSSLVLGREIFTAKCTFHDLSPMKKVGAAGHFLERRRLTSLSLFFETAARRLRSLDGENFLSAEPVDEFAGVDEVDVAAVVEVKIFFERRPIKIFLDFDELEIAVIGAKV